MTLRRAAALSKAWSRTPPAAEVLMLIARSLGAVSQGSRGETAGPAPSESLERLLSSMPQGAPEKVMSMSEYLEKRRNGRS